MQNEQIGCIDRKWIQLLVGLRAHVKYWTMCELLWVNSRRAPAHFVRLWNSIFLFLVAWRFGDEMSRRLKRLETTLRNISWRFALFVFFSSSLGDQPYGPLASIQRATQRDNLKQRLCLFMASVYGWCRTANSGSLTFWMCNNDEVWPNWLNSVTIFFFSNSNVMDIFGHLANFVK